MISVLFGGSLGLILGKYLKDSYRTILSVSVGLVTMILGIDMIIEANFLILTAFSLIIGGILGELLMIETRLLSLGVRLRQLLARRGSTGDAKRFARGLVDASILFCVGPMTILGSIESVLVNNNDIVFTKSLLDGFMAMILAAASGVGVLFSAVTILLVQGGFALGANLLQPWFDTAMIDSVSAVGGFMILMIMLNILELKRVPTANFLPSLVIVVILMRLRSLWG